jgi:hypothetical protein
MLPRYLIFIIYVFAAAAAAEFKLPQKITDGWIADKAVKTFISQNLYGHINGGAELFLEYGFEQLQIQSYTNGDQAVVLELYEMKTSNSALGIYLMKAGEEKPCAEIAVRNTVNTYQMLLTSANYFVQINNFGGDSSLVPIMVSLGQNIISQINREYNHNLFDYLPKENIVRNSERLFCGPYSLQSIYTFGKGDIFQLNGEIFGVSADYQTDSRESFTRLIIPYPSLENASAVFSNIIKNLDPYLEVTETAPDYFVFKDYKDKYGLIKVKNSMLSIIINLNTPPGSN